MLTFLRFLRGLFGFLAGLQVLQILPALSLMGAPGPLDTQMAAALVIKLAFLFIFGTVFVLLRGAINRRSPKTLQSFFAL